MLASGHSEGSRVVHLTWTTLCCEALCGELVTQDGEPELAVLCVECEASAEAAGSWPAGASEAAVAVAVQLPAAA